MDSDLSSAFGITNVYIEDGDLCLVYSNCSPFTPKVEIGNKCYGFSYSAEFIIRLKMDKELSDHIRYWYKTDYGEEYILPYSDDEE